MPVCITELGHIAKSKPKLDKLKINIIGLSVDPVGNHVRWATDIQEKQGTAPNYPVIGDPALSISRHYGILLLSTSGTSEGGAPADYQMARNVLKLTAENEAATPVNWKPEEDVNIAGLMSDE